MDALILIFQILFWITEFNLLYYVILYLVGLFAHKQKYEMVEDKLKFCIFVPCHNEQDVVDATVKDYINIQYNKDLYNIYFIADNCSDKTAEVLRQAIAESGAENFYVLERHESDPKKRGKPHALRWGIEKLEAEGQFYDKYDMFMILDADNFIDADILKHINSQYFHYKENKRPTIIQVYPDSKNKNNLIARGYFESYRVMNGFWQISKQALHLVPAVAGTGFAIDTAFLKSIGGFNCKSLTEDIEIMTIATLKNKRVVFNQNTRIYDEKPTGFKQAIVQRTRWAQGHWFVSLKFVPRILIQLFNPKTFLSFFKKFDMMMYLASRFFIVLALITFILGFCVQIIYPGVMIVPHPWDYINLACTIFSIIIIPIASLYDGGKEEKRRVLIEFIPNVISIYLIALMDVYASTIGLFKCWNQKTWKKTAHKVNAIQGGKFVAVEESESTTQVESATQTVGMEPNLVAEVQDNDIIEDLEQQNVTETEIEGNSEEIKNKEDEPSFESCETTEIVSIDIPSEQVVEEVASDTAREMDAKLEAEQILAHYIHK